MNSPISKTYDPQNVFARILRGELPCHKVFEDEDTLAIMDIMPRADGHVLVLPKRPARNLLDADDAMLAAVMKTVRRVSLAVMRAMQADGMTIQQFNEPAGGQVVYHLHVHVVPRWDGVAMRPHTGEMAKEADLVRHRDAIVAALG